MRVTNKPLLLVEDDRVDVMTITRALKEIHCVNPLVHVENGEEALAYLRDPTKDTSCLVLLDINMPIMNGIEFLREVKQDDALRRYPVVVLTTSEELQDKLSSFNLGVAGYMAKPVSYRLFIDVMRSIELYWSLSELPC